MNVVIVVHRRVEVRDVLAEFLRRRGLIAVPAADVASAAVLIQRIPADLVFLDGGIPEPTLRTLMLQLRQQSGNAIVAVLPADLRRTEEVCRWLLDRPAVRSRRRAHNPLHISRRQIAGTEIPGTRGVDHVSDDSAPGRPREA